MVEKHSFFFRDLLSLSFIKLELDRRQRIKHYYFSCQIKVFLFFKIFQEKYFDFGKCLLNKVFGGEMKKLCTFHPIFRYPHTSKNNAWISLFLIKNRKRKKKNISIEGWQKAIAQHFLSTCFRGFWDLEKMTSQTVYASLT